VIAKLLQRALVVLEDLTERTRREQAGLATAMRSMGGLHGRFQLSV
jgi:hypothetical protein